MLERSLNTQPRDPDAGPDAPQAARSAPRQGERPGPKPAPLEIVQLIRAHHQEVYRYAFRLTGQVADAEDVTQQTFLIAHGKLHQLRDPSKVRGWLFAILRSCYLKSRRKAVPVPAGSIALDVNHIPQAVDEDSIDPSQLQAAINQLPEQFKLVVVMHYFEQASYKQIAESLEIPIGTVMSRLSRAKGRLRAMLLTSAPPV